MKNSKIILTELKGLGLSQEQAATVINYICNLCAICYQDELGKYKDHSSDDCLEDYGDGWDFED
jgi:hypothetical protein